ncbi:MAG: hypothetical protein JXJ20_12985 [Anaerolineae bacterium]|nr:hypothetical protein [Anaerolineae bacterium]
MYPEDRVLVGVINRKRDLDKARYEHWYRVPQGKASTGIHAEYIAFYLSRAFKELNGGIHYYARRTGIELACRRDLLPEEADHPRADHLYHRLQLGELRRKDPPILNPTRRPVAFIYTTWDRFTEAKELADLYSQADHFVDRVFHALEQSGVKSRRIYEAEQGDDGAQIRVSCKKGTIIASTAAQGEHVIPLEADNSAEAIQASVDVILAAIEAYGGPQMVNVPIEG